MSGAGQEERRGREPVGSEAAEPIWVAAPTLAQDVHTSCVVPLNQLKMPLSERLAT